MCKTARADCATITFFSIVLYKTADLRRKYALIDTTFFVKNIPNNIGSILLGRNKARTGKHISISSSNKSMRIYKASKFLLTLSQDIHQHFVLNQT